MFLMKKQESGPRPSNYITGAMKINKNEM